MTEPRKTFVDSAGMSSVSDKLVRIAIALAKRSWRSSNRISSFAVLLTSRNRITGSALRRPSVFVLEVPDDGEPERRVSEAVAQLGALALVYVLPDARQRQVGLWLEAPNGSQEWVASTTGTGVGAFRRVGGGGAKRWISTWTTAGGVSTISGVRRAGEVGEAAQATQRITSPDAG